MYFSVCLWPWLPVNYLPVLSLGNDAPAEEKLLWSQRVEGCSHWEASIIKLDWNPALAGGWLASWDGSFSKGSCCMKCLMLVTMLSILVNLMVDFSTNSHLGLFRSNTAAETSTDSIKLQDEGVYIVFFFIFYPRQFSSPALPLKQNIAFLCIKPNYKISAGSDERVIQRKTI